jgi:FkbH-like protein
MGEKMAQTFTQEEIKLKLAAVDTTDASALIKLANRAEKSDLYENFSGKKVKIAILGANSVQYLCKVIRLFLFAKYGISADIFEGEYNRIAEAILNEASELYSFAPDITILIPDVSDIREFPMLLSDTDAVGEVVRKNTEYYQSLWGKILRRGSPILQANFVIPATSQLGNLECNYVYSKNTFLKKLNLFLIEAKPLGVSFVDLDSLASNVGKNKWFDYTSYFISKQGFCLDFLGVVCDLFSAQISALSGKIRKCLVLDLDNTLWGGVVGDVGANGIELDPNNAVGEAYRSFQKYILSLKERGVILAVCSKNDIDIAQEPFSTNPYMLIKLEDISCFIANWEDKATNLRRIARELNIGTDSLVFFDDNPAEREIARLNLPEVRVIDVPKDPAYYMAALDASHCFDWSQIAKEDLNRTSSYLSGKKRFEMESSYVNYDEYLQALEMKAEINFLDAGRVPRFSQLTMKSNQFNLRARRYSEAMISDLLTNSDYYVFYVELSDKFDNYGLISCVILEKIDDFCFIDTWLMSCRVLKRGVENLVLNAIVKAAVDLGCTKIVGEYIFTAKNSMVKNFYPELGFKKLDGKNLLPCLTKDGEAYILNASDYTEAKTFIILKEKN